MIVIVVGGGGAWRGKYRLVGVLKLSAHSHGYGFSGMWWVWE